MTDKDRYVIYKMFVFIMRALLLLVFRAYLTEHTELQDDYLEFCAALDNEESWNWLKYNMR